MRGSPRGASKTFPRPCEEGVRAGEEETVGNRYAAPRGAVSHLDLYRSAGLTIEEWADIEPYFGDAVVFVEWPDAGAAMLPGPRATVTIDIGDGDARLIRLVCDDPGLLNAIAAALPGYGH